MNRQVFYIDSSDRISGSSSEFTVRLPNFRSNAPANRIVCTGAIIPKSWYLVNSPWNTFTLTELLNTYTITIPEGNYSFRTIASTLTTLMNNASGYTYTVTAVNRTGLLTFTVTGNAGDQPIISFSDYPYGIHPLRRVTGLAASNAFVADSLTSTNVCQVQLTNSVKVLSELAEGGVLVDIFSASLDFTVLSYIDTNGSMGQKSLTKFTDTIDIKIVDYITEQVLNLRGADVQMTIVIFYDNNPMDRLTKIAEDMSMSFRLTALAEDLEKLRRKTIERNSRLINERGNDNTTAVENTGSKSLDSSQ